MGGRGARPTNFDTRQSTGTEQSLPNIIMSVLTGTVLFEYDWYFISLCYYCCFLFVWITVIKCTSFRQESFMFNKKLRLSADLNPNTIVNLDTDLKWFEFAENIDITTKFWECMLIRVVFNQVIAVYWRIFRVAISIDPDQYTRFSLRDTPLATPSTWLWHF